MPSPSHAATFGRGTTCRDTSKPPTDTVSKPTGPATNSEVPYVILKLTFGNGSKVFDAFTLKPVVPKLQVAGGTGLPVRLKH